MTTEVTVLNRNLHVPDIKVYDHKLARMESGGRHLEQVRDDLLKLRENTDPLDFDRRVNTFSFKMPNGVPFAQLVPITSKGAGEPWRFTKHGLAQFAREVLPAYGLRFLDELSRIPERAEGDRDPSGYKKRLASGDPSLFARSSAMSEAIFNRFIQNADDVPRMFRTVNVPVHGRTIRACLSQSYQPVDTLFLVENLLKNTQARELPVLRASITPNGACIRFGIGAVPGKIEKGTAIPMMELWNDEVGTGSVIFAAGLYKLICTNGVGSWTERQEYRWRHVGNRQRITASINEAIDTIKAESAGIHAAYKRALEVRIDDVFGFVEAISTPGNGQLFSRETGNEVRKALADPTVSKTASGEPIMLASVVDAITLVAQERADIFEQRELEVIAGSIMGKGTENAKTVASNLIHVERQAEGKRPRIVW